METLEVDHANTANWYFHKDAGGFNEEKTSFQQMVLKIWDIHIYKKSETCLIFLELLKKYIIDLNLNHG